MGLFNWNQKEPKNEWDDDLEQSDSIDHDKGNSPSPSSSPSSLSLPSSSSSSSSTSPSSLSPFQSSASTSSFLTHYSTEWQIWMRRHGISAKLDFLIDSEIAADQQNKVKSAEDDFHQREMEAAKAGRRKLWEDDLHAEQLSTIKLEEAQGKERGHKDRDQVLEIEKSNQIKESEKPKEQSKEVEKTKVTDMFVNAAGAGFIVGTGIGVGMSVINFLLKRNPISPWNVGTQCAKLSLFLTAFEMGLEKIARFFYQESNLTPAPAPVSLKTTPNILDNSPMTSAYDQNEYFEGNKVRQEEKEEEQLRI